MVIATPTKRSLVYVVWEDHWSETKGGWREDLGKAFEDVQPMSIETVGFVVSENKKVLILSQSVADEAESSSPFAPLMIILKKCITQREEIT